MLKDAKKWRELHPRERLVLFGISHAMTKNNREPVPVKILGHITGIQDRQLASDLLALQSWGLVRILPTDQPIGSVILAGEAAASPLLPQPR